MSTLKDLRIDKGLTQKQTAAMMGISLRSYKSYENEEKKAGTLKYDYMVEKLTALDPVDEETGLLTLDTIKRKCTNIMKNYEIKYCYLYGAYAKDSAVPESKVDLLVSANTLGVRLYALADELRGSLHKRVDLIDVRHLSNNLRLTDEILRDGIKIYG